MAANVVEFSIKGKDNFSGTFSKMGSSIKSVAKGLTIATTALAGAATAVAVFVNKVSSAQNETAQFAARLSIAVDKLSEFQFAAKLANISATNMNLILQRATRRVAEAAQGLGEAKDAIKELGLEAKELANLPVDEQFLKITDALEGVTNGSDKLRLAFKLFDSEGTAVLQVLNDQSNAFRKLAEDAKFLGVSLSAGAAANAKEFQNQLGRATSAISGLAQGISNELTPLLAGLSQNFANALAGARDQIVAFARDAIRFVIGAGIVISNVAGQINQAFKKAFSVQGLIELLQGFTKFASFALAIWSKVAFEMGKLLIQGFKLAFVTLLELARIWTTNTIAFWVAAFPRIPRLIVKSFQFAFESIVELANTAWQKIFDLFTGNDIARSFGETFEQEIKTRFSSIGQEFQNFFNEIDAEGAFQSFEGALDQLATATGPALEGVMAQFEVFKSVLGDSLGELKETIADTFGFDEDLIQAQIDSVLERFALFGEEAALSQQLQAEETKSFIEELLLANQEFMLNMQSVQQQFAVEFQNLMQTTINAISQSIAKTIIEGGSLLSAFKQIGKQILAGIIQILIKVALQRLLTAAIFKAAQTSEASTALASGLATTFVNTMSSISAIPFVGPFLAPGVAAATTAIAAAGAASSGATGAALGAGIAGAAQGGLENVPDTGTFLLHAGERVVAAEQNKDLTNFLDEGSAGGGTTIENIEIHIMENATSGDALLEMDPNELREVVASKIIPAFNELDTAGIRPNSAERQRDV